MIDVDVLLYDGLDELDAVGPFEILAAAGMTPRTVAVNASRPVTGSHGLRIGVDAVLGTPPTLLVVPGGGWASDAGGVRTVIRDGTIPAWILECHAAGTVIAAVCTGGLIVASTGLLEGRPAVTHHLGLDGLRTMGADVRPDARVIDDGELLTCGGVTSGLDLAMHLVERYLGADAATAAAERIEHERRGPVLVTAASA